MSDLLDSAAARGAAHATATGRPSRALEEPRVDLHMHSTFSDGTKTPEELCRMARKAGVEVLALCDHDTVAGLPAMREAAGAYPEISLIPGVEISTGESGSVHVLGYGPAVTSDGMTAFLQTVAADRVGRARKMLDRLDAEGIRIPDETRHALLQNSGVGRPHIARALVDMGVVSTARQAFERYLARGRCAYVARELPSTAEAVRTMRRLGVVPVLAHPALMELEWSALAALVAELRQCGLMGLEAYHPSVNAREARQLDTLARRMELIVTGGSDYHGDPGNTAHIGRLPAGWHGRRDDVRALVDATHM